MNHVHEPTHRAGHILDLVITRTSSEHIISGVRITKPMISDHFFVHFKLLCEKPIYEQKQITFRKLRSIDKDSFREDIINSTLSQNSDSSTYEVVEKYDSILGDILDKHAPQKTSTITLRPQAPWYNDAIDRAKRKWRKSGGQAYHTGGMC